MYFIYNAYKNEYQWGIEECSLQANRHGVILSNYQTKTVNFTVDDHSLYFSLPIFSKEGIHFKGKISSPAIQGFILPAGYFISNSFKRMGVFFERVKLRAVYLLPFLIITCIFPFTLSRDFTAPKDLYTAKEELWLLNNIESSKRFKATSRAKSLSFASEARPIGGETKYGFIPLGAKLEGQWFYLITTEKFGRLIPTSVSEKDFKDCNKFGIYRFKESTAFVFKANTKAEVPYVILPESSSRQEDFNCFYFSKTAKAAFGIST